MVTRGVIAVTLVGKIGRVLRTKGQAWGFGRAQQAAATTFPSTRMAGLPRRGTCTAVR